jgi:hypothetical protein
VSVNDGGVKHIHVYVTGTNEKTNLGAAEQNALGATINQLGDYGSVGLTRGVIDYAHAR